MGSSRDLWDDDIDFKIEEERKRKAKEAHEQQMAAEGYVEIPVEFRFLFNKQQWIHSETLRHLRAWLTDDTVYKLVRAPE